MKGCIHIYCGDGKGKTTAAVGLAVRAAGRKKKILVSRFLKTDDSGEVAVLDRIPGITVVPCRKTFGFYFQMTDKQKAEAKTYYSQMFDEVWERAAADSFDMVVLDEIMAACNYGLVDEEKVRKALEEKPENLEVVMTGRNPSEGLLRLADYVSEIQKKKHPFDEGVAAREGIEY